jgi:hypothetical protein
LQICELEKKIIIWQKGAMTFAVSTLVTLTLSVTKATFLLGDVMLSQDYSQLYDI